MNVVTNAQESGRPRVAVFGGQSLTGAGNLLNLRFNVTGQASASSSLVWQNFLFNEGEPALVKTNGSVNVTSQTVRAVFDYDSDGKSDISVYRPDGGAWYINQSTKGFTAAQFGISTDLPTPVDYDGDGKTDIAVFSPTDGGNW